MNRRDTLLASLLSLGLVVLLIPLARSGVDFHHDGIMLKPALDVLSGQVLFRDTFMQYGALSCYLQVLALRFYPSLLSLKLLTVAAYGVTCFFLYASWRLILPRSLTILACSLFILFIPWYENDWQGHALIVHPWSSVFAMMFQSMGLYALFRIIRGERSDQWGLVLGVACAAVFWCRQPVGLLLIGCVVVVWVALLWTNWSSNHFAKSSVFARISGGFVAVNGIMLGGIFLSGGGSEWWYQNYIWPKKWAADMYEGWSYFLDQFIHPAFGVGLLVLLLAVSAPAFIRRFRPSLPAGVFMVYFFLIGALLLWQHELTLRVFDLRKGGWATLFPLIILWQAIVCVVRAFGTQGRAHHSEYYLIAALSALSLASLPQYYPVADSWHVLWSLAPSFGLFVFVLWRWLEWRPAVLVTGLTLVFLPSLWVKTQLMIAAFKQPTVTLISPAILRGMKVSAQQARVIAQIMATLEPVARYRPDMPSVLIGNDAMYLCLIRNHTNPSPYFVTWEKLADQETERKRWGYISSVRPLLFWHKANRESVDDFLRSAHYVSILQISEEGLEIAIPRELADTISRMP